MSTRYQKVLPKTLAQHRLPRIREVTGPPNLIPAHEAIRLDTAAWTGKHNEVRDIYQSRRQDLEGLLELPPLTFPMPNSVRNMGQPVKMISMEPPTVADGPKMSVKTVLLFKMEGVYFLSPSGLDSKMGVRGLKRVAEVGAGILTENHLQTASSDGNRSDETRRGSRYSMDVNGDTMVMAREPEDLRS